METAVRPNLLPLPPLNGVAKALSLSALTGTCFLLLTRPVFRWDAAFLTAPAIDERASDRADIPLVVRPQTSPSRPLTADRATATAPPNRAPIAPTSRSPASSDRLEAASGSAPPQPETSDRAPELSRSAIAIAPATTPAQQLAAAPTTLAAAAQQLAPAASPTPPPTLAELSTPPRFTRPPLPLPQEPSPPSAVATAPVLPPLAAPSRPDASDSTAIAPAATAPVTPPDEQAALPEVTEPAEPEGFFVEQFEVLGSSIFSAETLAEVAQAAALRTEALTATASDEIPPAEAINRNLTLSDLVRASDAITDYYVSRGYITSGAFIPAEALAGDTSTIAIQIIEGSLEAVNVTLNPLDPIELSALPSAITQPAADWFRVPSAPVAPSNLPESRFLDNIETLGQLQQSSQAADLASNTLQISYQTWGIDQPYQSLETPAGSPSPTYLAVDSATLTSPFGSPFARSLSNLVMRDWLDPAYSNRYIDVTVDRPLDPGYIGSRLAIAGEAPLNINRVLAGVQVLQINPLIETISTELVTGTRTGTSILNVAATQASSDQVSFTIDNNQSPSVGSLRQTAQVSQGNLSGLGDGLFFGASRTEGSRNFDLSYAVPISPYDTTLRFSFSDSDSEILTEAFSALDIQTDSTLYEVALEQPIFKSPTQQFTLSLIGSYRESQSEFLEGLPFPATGADDDGFTRVAALRFAQDWLQQGETQVFALRSQFSLGLDTLGSTINEDPPDSRFLSWRGRAQFAKLFAPDSLLLVRGDLQLSDRPLVPNEQIGLGGQATVRGYRQNTLLTDNGWLASAELRLPILRIPEIEGLLQVSPFFDIGQGWNHPDNPTDSPDPNLISGAGIGLIWRQGDYLSARLDWGIPITSIDYDIEEGTLQESGIYFSITFTP
ncbi:ShlB/FhaC/HecB family hemolysin secretion/activation protein [Almyronema epifaneia]|uniref:ShlB/FhaC/HecB family hemolysin secretion/activation protein n=1 Tax=Almyronema epifaneia S1 TaxID=2991925 RepID=A0ABW6IDI6_9CYAN